MAVSRVTTSAARRPEPGWRLWSTVMPPARTSSLRASKASAEASAMESAPPEQATRTSRGVGPFGEGGQGAARGAGLGVGGAGGVCGAPGRFGGPVGAGVPVEFGDDVVEYAADRQAYRRDRRMGTHRPVPFVEFGRSVERRNA